MFLIKAVFLKLCPGAPLEDHGMLLIILFHNEIDWNNTHCLILLNKVLM